MPNLVETASPLEVYAAVAALFGSLISFGLLVAAWRDLATIWPGAPDDPDITTAWVGLAHEGLRLICLVAILAMAIALMLLPSLSGRADTPSTSGLVFVGGMLVIEHALVAKSVIGWWGRRKIWAQTERWRDPCADCPWPHSPYRERAQVARARRESQGKAPLSPAYVQESVMHTDVADVHVTLTPPTTPEHPEQEAS